MSHMFVTSVQVSVHGADQPSRCNAGRRYCTCLEEDERVCCIRGYYVFKDIQEAQTGETLAYEREPHVQNIGSGPLATALSPPQSPITPFVRCHPYSAGLLCSGLYST